VSEWITKWMNMATEQTTPPRASPSTPSLALEKDVAVALVGENAREIDAHVEARVLSKIDWFLIPAMVVGTSRPALLTLSYSALIFCHTISPPRTSKPMLNQTPPNRLRPRLLRQSDPRVRGPLRHDEGPRPHGDLDRDDAADDKHVAPQLGDVAVLLWHAGGPVSHDVCAAAVQHWADPRRGRDCVGRRVYAYCGRDDASGAVCSAVFSGLRRVGYPDGVHVCD
jgi:hypothetical protein